MDVLLWVLQWALAALLLLSFLALPVALRRARNRLTAMLVGLVGLASAVALVVPWWTGRLEVLTPIAATTVAVFVVVDSLTNRVPGGDRLYNVVVLAMAVTVAIGRFLSVADRGVAHSFTSWAFIVGGGLLVTSAMVAGRSRSPVVAPAQALTGLAGIAGGTLGLIPD